MMGFDDESEGEIPAQIWTQLSLNQKLQKPRLEVLQRFRKSSQNFSVSVPTSEIPIIRQSPSQPFLLQLKVVNPQLTTEIRQESRDSIWCTLPFPGCIHSPTAMPNSIEALHLMRGKAHWELTCPKCSEQTFEQKVESWSLMRFAQIMKLSNTGPLLHTNLKKQACVWHYLRFAKMLSSTASKICLRHKRSLPQTSKVSCHSKSTWVAWA